MTNESAPSRGLIDAFSAQSIPAEIVASMKTFPSADSGQVWRARWDARVATVLLLSVRPGSLQVASASLTAAGDAGSVTYTSGQTGAALDITVWPGEQASIPERVLDCLFVPATPALAAVATEVSGVGTPDMPLAELPRPKAARLDALEAFAGVASWKSEAGSTLRGVLGEIGVAPSLLAAAGISAARVAALLKGKAALSLEEIELVATATSIPRDALTDTGVTVPDDLADAIDAPRNRAKVDQVMRVLDLSDHQARQELARVAYALAARQTGSRSVNWENRLEHAVQSICRSET